MLKNCQNYTLVFELFSFGPPLFKFKRTEILWGFRNPKSSICWKFQLSISKTVGCPHLGDVNISNLASPLLRFMTSNGTEKSINGKQIFSVFLGLKKLTSTISYFATLATRKRKHQNKYPSNERPRSKLLWSCSSLSLTFVQKIIQKLTTKITQINAN